MKVRATISFSGLISMYAGEVREVEDSYIPVSYTHLDVYKRQVSGCFFRAKVEDIMLKSCPYCGKIHDKKYNCPKKPVRQRQDNRQSKFRSTYKWTKKAQAVKRRDGYLCQVCLRGLYHPERQYETEGLEVHHIQTVASCYRCV